MAIESNKKIYFYMLIILILAFLLLAIKTDASWGNPESEIARITEEIGAEYNICPELLQAVIERESSNNPNAKNGNCIGLMQINKAVHKDRMDKLGVTDLYDPYSNILVGADYLAELFSQNEDIYLVLMKYNMSHKTARLRYVEGDYTDYAVEIAERSAELERLHGK